MSELSRLGWRCRRGMKELDMVLSQYLEGYYETASRTEQASFNSLLEMDDPDLYNLLLGRSETNDPDLAGLIQDLRKLSNAQ